MSDERASGAVDGISPTVAIEVAGDAANGTTPEGEAIPASDFNALKSKYDKELAARDAQIATMGQTLSQVQAETERVRQESLAARTEKMTPTERAAFERDEAVRELSVYKARENEAEAKRNIAGGIAEGFKAFNITPDMLMSASNAGEMYSIAAKVVAEQTARPPVAPATPANSPTPSGASLTSTVTPDITEQRSQLLQSRDNQAFLKSWTPQKRE